MKTKTDISIVIPCYNEGGVIQTTITTVRQVLIEDFPGNSFEIIVVNDGSKDNSAQRIQESSLQYDEVDMISYVKNQGKGYAVKAGLTKACGSIIAFIDADMEIPPQLLSTYIRKMKVENADCVVGSKLHRQSVTNQTSKRKALSFVSHKMIEILFQLKNIDTQVGIKVFKKDILKKALTELKASSFAFDIELLVLIQKNGDVIKSAPVYIDQDNAQSKVGAGSVAKTFLDTMNIYHRTKSKVHVNSWRSSIIRTTCVAMVFLPLETAFKILAR